MDKGVFRRVGDSGPWRLSHVRYILRQRNRKKIFLETFDEEFRLFVLCLITKIEKLANEKRLSSIY